MTELDPESMMLFVKGHWGEGHEREPSELKGGCVSGGILGMLPGAQSPAHPRGAVLNPKSRLGGFR